MSHLGPVAAGLVLATPFTPWPVLTTGIVVATLLAARLFAAREKGGGAWIGVGEMNEVG